MKAELVSSALPVSTLGEGPHWDARGKKLYWCDIIGRKIHRYDPASGTHDFCAPPAMPGFAVLDEQGQIVAGLRDGIYRIDFSNGSNQCLLRPQYAHPDNRFNDGKCDRRGRLWGGTMNNNDHSLATGALYRLDERGLHEQATNIHISNGLGWSPDNKIMYYTDTVQRVIWQYDYDLDAGTAHSRRTFVEFKDKGRPDGLCVDAQGRVLTAQWPGWGIEIYTPDGKPDGRIDLPVPQVSSCAFGGDDLKTLYITTAAENMDDAGLKEAPLSGRLFAIHMDVAGLPETPYRG
ncbi:MAG: SMP-30/gluconolactonase/LRE family protein [Micavibrio sp.]|nr:SMP-30/gluconolactonase/LRE family protein [Micavibrio sp.]